MTWGARTGSVCAFVLVLAFQRFGYAQEPAPADSLDPLLARLASWVDPVLERSYGYASVATGAALTAGFEPDSGFHLPASLKLLWPGNLALVADTAYAPLRPHSVKAAERELVTALAGARRVLLITPEPVMVYGVDSAFGEPWFMVARGAPDRADSALWDAGDLRREWWLWSDLAGANALWPRPERARAARGRTAVLAGLRHCVLAARPNKGTLNTGLAAFEGVPDNVGPRVELIRLAVIRQAAARYLQEELDLWPPAQREPVKLAIYHFEKAARAWRELADRSADWSLTSAPRREELLLALANHETGAAVALDGMVSPRQ